MDVNYFLIFISTQEFMSRNYFNAVEINSLENIDNLVTDVVILVGKRRISNT